MLKIQTKFQIAYRITIERDGQKLLYQKFIQVTKRMLLYRQIRKIDDEEQKISADIQYNIKSNLLLLIIMICIIIVNICIIQKGLK